MAKKNVPPSNSSDEIEVLRKRVVALEAALAAEKRNAIAANNATERYRLAIEHAPDVLLALDCDGNILISNETPPGETPESVVGKSIFDFITTPDHREKLSNALQFVLKTGKTASYEHQDADGVWYATRVSPIEKDGEIVAVSVVGTNIQSYKQLQAEYSRVLDAERRQRELAEALRDAGTAFSSTLDLDTIIDALLTQIARVVPYDAANVMVVENNIARIHQARGYDSFGEISLEEIQGLTFDVRQTPNLRTMLKTKRPLIIPDTSRDPNWVHVRPKTAIRSWAGAPIIVQGEVVAFFSLDKAEANFYQMDDAARLAAFAGQAAVAIKNAALFEESRRQARLVQQILDSVSQGIVLLDKDCRIKLTNPTADRLLPALSDSPLSEPITKLGDTPFSILLEATEEWHELTAVDDSAAIFSATVHPIQSASGIEGWVLVFRDVTNEHAMQQRIYQQERLAALGQMAAGIAHDFNNILTSMIGFADLINRQPGIPPSSKPLLNNIVAQGQKGAQLIGQILDFSRQSVSRKKPIGIASYLNDTIKLLRRLIPENITITEEIDDSLASVVINIDAAQIQQVFTNLAINARDAMPGGGTLSFKLSQLNLLPDDTPPFHLMPPGKWLHLAITDTGEGIDENLLQHIFEPFFTTKDVGKGTGLGLSQAYGIMKQHGGYITAESKVATGTTIHLYFPMDESDITAQVSPEKSELLPQGHGETILLVEDELAVLSVGKAMLKHLGYSVLTAKDGYEALAEFDKSQQEIALVLTDITMPRLGGIALAKQLKERDPNLKILALSGYPLEGGEKSYLAKGFLGWLQKPLNISQLAVAIADALA